MNAVELIEELSVMVEDLEDDDEYEVAYGVRLAMEYIEVAHG